ncbi:MAG: ABC transporter permease [Spirochaetales bacterium]|nr:ABC transporter permease [Spirochaetales bacterium]
MVEGIFVEGLIYSILALGVFLTFRVLDFPDLTVDGTFPLGASVMAICLTGGMPMPLALLLSFLCGCAAGVVTAVIHNKLGVPGLLAGILTMTMLWSINIRVLGNRANLPLLRTDTILTRVEKVFGPVFGETAAILIFFFLVVLVIKVLLDLFFHTDLGLTMGALGDNQQMVISQGVNPEMVKIIGVGLSNGLVAVSGAFAAQYLGFADVNLGIGIVVSGLAMVMLGEFLFSSTRISLLTLRVILGAILYKAIMFAGRYYGYYIRLTPNDLKLLTGILIIACLTISRYRSRGFHFTGRRK